MQPTPTATPDDGDKTPVPVTPTPTPTPPVPAAPRVTSLKVKVTPCSRGKACKRSAKVTVKLSRTATVALKVERKQGRKWKRVTVKSVHGVDRAARA